MLMLAAKSNRYGHRDATMILVGYRHGLRHLSRKLAWVAAGRCRLPRAALGSLGSAY